MTEIIDILKSRYKLSDIECPLGYPGIKCCADEIEKLQNFRDRIARILKQPLSDCDDLLIVGLDACRINRQATEIERLQGKPKEGLYGKYRIAKTDGSSVDPDADYFILRLDTDPIARRAAWEYSYYMLSSGGDRQLVKDLQTRLTKYDPKKEDCVSLRYVGLLKSELVEKYEQQAARIAELEGWLIDERAQYIRTLEDNPGCSAWDFDELGEDAQNRYQADAKTMLDAEGKIGGTVANRMPSNLVMITKLETDDQFMPQKPSFREAVEDNRETLRRVNDAIRSGDHIQEKPEMVGLTKEQRAALENLVALAEDEYDNGQPNWKYEKEVELVRALLVSPSSWKATGKRRGVISRVVDSMRDNVGEK